MTELSTLFLVFGLFFPRITLLCTYFISDTMPANPSPFALDVIGAIFLPRFLIAGYVWFNQGIDGWFWAYIIFGVLGLVTDRTIGSSATTSSKRPR
jgi:hypothetical protein